MTSNSPAGSSLTVRRVAFEYPDDVDAAWVSRLPELAYAANGVSLHMPYAEPFFVRSVRAAMPELDDDLRLVADDFAQQEAQHHRQHHKFNGIIKARYPGVRHVEKWMDRAYRWLDRRSLRFRIAYLASAETMAYALARWTDKNLGTLFAGADPVVTTLFLWHLAEEVEHKSVAYDIFEAVDGSRLRYALAGVTAVGLTLVFTIANLIVMLAKDRRLFKPVAWWRVAKLAVTLAFEVLPTMAVSAMPGHHPSKLVDPSFLVLWLREFDPQTRTMPLWEPAA